MKIAIIGCGNIGSKRALSLLKDKDCNIKYIVGRVKLKKPIENRTDVIAKECPLKLRNGKKVEKATKM